MTIVPERREARAGVRSAINAQFWGQVRATHQPVPLVCFRYRRCEDAVSSSRVPSFCKTCSKWPRLRTCPASPSFPRGSWHLCHWHGPLECRAASRCSSRSAWATSPACLPSRPRMAASFSTEPWSRRVEAGGGGPLWGACGENPPPSPPPLTSNGVSRSLSASPLVFSPLFQSLFSVLPPSPGTSPLRPLPCLLG